jgi:poly-gamma-glutamate synthesis protein (capsule biosynthesis protein)
VLIRLAPDTRGTVTFAFGGDVMFGRRYFDPDEDGSIDGLLSLDADVDDHVRLLDGVRPALSDADLTVVNLETPLSDDPYPDPRGPRPRAFHPTKDYVFASRPAAAGALAKVGIDVVGIANNHLFDQLAPGVASTRAALEAAGYQPGTGYFGAGAGEEEAWAPAIREVEGQRVAFVGCTSITGDEHPITYVAGPRKGGAARCEPARLRSQVARAAAGADIVVAMIHGGYEYGREPSGQVRALSDTAVSAGATMVINHHPHVVGGLRFAGGRLTAWTLGNLLFDQTVWPTFESYLLRVAVRDGKVVSAWTEPVRIQRFQPFGVFGEDAEWVARGAHARSDGPWTVDDGSLWLDATGKAEARTVTAGAAGEVTEVRSGCSPSAGRDLLWSGDFEDRDLDDTGGVPLWNVGDDTKDRRVIEGSTIRGRAVRLRRSGADREDILLSPRHRILVTPRKDLTVLLSHRNVSGPGDLALMLSWYNDTRGGSQSRTTVPLRRGEDWMTTRVDVRVPDNAVAVQPFVRLRPPELSLAAVDVDEVRLIGWGEPGCGYVRGRASVDRRAVAPLPAAPDVETVVAEQARVASPPALPPGPPDR